MSKKRQNPRNILEFILITIAIVLVVAVLKYMDNLYAYTNEIQTYALQTNITGIGNFNGLLQ